MKNKITFAFMLLLCTVFTNAQTLTTVFSDNFDATSETLNTNGWVQWSGSISLIYSATSNSGTHCAQFGGTNNASCYLRKTVSVTAGKTYIYSAYTQASAGKGHALGYNSTALGDHGTSTFTNSAWGQHSISFKATATESLDIYVYQWSTGTVWVDDVLLQQQQWNIAASSNNVAYGSVSGTTGLTDPGTTVSLTATPTSGYYFVNWTEGGSAVSVSSTYTFTASSARTLVANFAPVSASITLTGTLSSFSSTYGTASTAQSFSVAGSSLTTDIIVTPPTGFEVSLSSGSGYLSSVTLPQLSGTVATTPVYVRLKATAPAATYSAANITVNTTGSSQTESCSGTVAKKALSVTGYSIASKTYNGNTASGTITVGTITGFVGTETVTATASCTLSSPNVYGEQGTIVFTLVNGTNGGLASNYSLANGSYWAPISQAQLNITTGNQTVTYGTAASAVTAAGAYTPSGFVGSDNSGLMTGTATYTTTYTNTTAVGTAGVTINYNTGLSTTYSNYWMNKIAGTITVTAATPTVTPTVGSYTYTGSPQGPNAATNTGTGSSYTYSYAGTGATSYGASPTQPTAAGTYNVTATVAANGNYAQASSSATAFSITKATPTLTVTNTPVTYDGTPKSATANALGGGVVSNISTGGAATQTNAGTYTVTANIAASTNYNAATGVTASNSFVISKAVLTITADNQDVTYGTAATDVIAAGSYTPTGFVNGESASVISGSVTYSTNYTATTDAGTSGITITPDVTALTATNYSFTPASRAIYIIKAMPTLSVSGTQSFTFTGSAQGPATVTYNGDGTTSLLYTNTDGTAYSSTTAPSNAGNYKVVATATAGTNYRATMSADYTFTIYSTGVVSAANTNVSSLVLSPASDISVSATGSLFIDANTSVHSLIVAAGGQLTINSGKNLSLSANFDLYSNESGSVGTLLNLNSTGGMSVSGTSTVNQYLSGARNWYISAPVSGSHVPASGYTFYSRNEPGATWFNMNSDSILKVGRGYIANLTTGTAYYNFEGPVNTGDKSVGLGKTNGVDKSGFNLIGNPYPSHYTVTKLATDAANALNTIWYRTATWVEDTKVPANSKYVYSFETCLLQPGGAVVGTPETTTNIIAPMQSFWVRTSTDGSTFTFANAQRSHQSSNLLKAPAKNNSSEPMIRLQVSNGKISDETILYSNVNALDAFDSYDALKMNNNSSLIPEIYTLVDNQQAAINGMSNLPYEKEITIGFTTLSSGMFSIKGSQFSNFSSGTQMILKDYADVNNPVTADLSDGSSYAFSSNVSINNTSRFSLLFHAPSITTGVNTADNSSIWISADANGDVVINGTTNAEGKVAVYNVAGQKIYSNNLTKGTIRLGNTLPVGVYMLSVTNAGKTITKKIVID